ncbi:MAG: hypothetical protein IIC10_01750 [Proteobacteria bacterium]|nr:hypothetical protein [Pseudomonadota bacterium]
MKKHSLIRDEPFKRKLNRRNLLRRGMAGLGLVPVLAPWARHSSRLPCLDASLQLRRRQRPTAKCW